MQLLIRPLTDPGTEIDVTERLVAAIAEEIGRKAGGNLVLNRLEARMHLEAMLAGSLDGPVVPRDGGAAR